MSPVLTPDIGNRNTITKVNEPYIRALAWSRTKPVNIPSWSRKIKIQRLVKRPVKITNHFPSEYFHHFNFRTTVKKAIKALSAIDQNAYVPASITFSVAVPIVL